MNELRRRDMTAVLFLNNSWDWSGGYSMYLKWAGYGEPPVPEIDGWPAYMEYVKSSSSQIVLKFCFANMLIL